MRLILRGAAVLIAVLAVVLVSAAAYRAYRQHQIAQAIEIRSPQGIDEAAYVTLGVVDHWLTIRGHDRSNPVLLMLDGGPGAAASVFNPSRWEKDFTVVEWDQPGAGKTFGRAGGVIDPALTIEAVVNDGISLAQYLIRHLGKDKVGLLGSSWGSVLGVHMVKRRPDLFYAYVGTGQVVNMQRAEALGYAQVLAKARARNDVQAIQELESIGAPPYASDTEFRTQRKWAGAYESGTPPPDTIIRALLFAPDYSLFDARNWLSAFLASQDHFFGKRMDGPAMSTDLPALGTDFSVPFFVLQGMEDDYTPFELTQAYVEAISAPEKLLVAVPGAGHYASSTHSDEMSTLLLERVRPLAIASPTPQTE